VAYDRRQMSTWSAPCFSTVSVLSRPVAHTRREEARGGRRQGTREETRAGKPTPKSTQDESSRQSRAEAARDKPPPLSSPRLPTTDNNIHSQHPGGRILLTAWSCARRHGAGLRCERDTRSGSVPQVNENRCFDAHEVVANL